MTANYPATQVAVHLSSGVGGDIAYLNVPQGGFQLVWRSGPGSPSGVTLGTPPLGYYVGVTALNVAGMAAVASAVNTYLGGLSATQKAQLPQQVNCCPYVVITPGEVNVPVHPSDVVTFAATLAAILNNSSNAGPVGT